MNRIDDEIWKLAQLVFTTGRYPEMHKKYRRINSEREQNRYIDLIDEITTIASIELTMRRGGEAGMSPLASLYNIVWYNDRPCIWGDAALARCMVHPEYVSHEETYDEATQTATCIVRRRDKEGAVQTHKQTYSWADAEKAKLNRLQHYREYSRRMLQWRARHWALRDAFADVFAGLSVAEEQMDIEMMVKSDNKDAGPPVKRDEETDEFTKNELEQRGEAPAPDFNSLKDGAPINTGDGVALKSVAHPGSEGPPTPEQAADLLEQDKEGKVYLGPNEKSALEKIRDDVKPKAKKKTTKKKSVKKKSPAKTDVVESKTDRAIDL